MSYPRVLIVALGRINAADTSNNGLLLRNLFGGWPRENLAQIYSSGDNGDAGFFGRYYQLGPQDRRLGKLFYRLKAGELKVKTNEAVSGASIAGASGIFTCLKSGLRKLLMDTGVYELIFRPQLSQELIAWVNEFKPDIIFAQGYNLTFTWLPVILSDHRSLPLVYYPTDDWPADLYRKGFFSALFVRRVVRNSARKLVETASLRLAFNRFMLEEYQGRYGRDFTVLMHGDVSARYTAVQPERLADAGQYWLVSTGVFEQHRYPLLYDIEKACEMLNLKGVRAKATIFPVNPLTELSGNTSFRHVSFEPCPSHDRLAAILRGADILLLPERFDETAEDIRLCVSSKAHLFMLSGRPTIVYSDSRAGITRYAREEGWAVVVDKRDPALLANAIEKLATESGYRDKLVADAYDTAKKNHDLELIQSCFRDLVNSVVIRSRGESCESI